MLSELLLTEIGRLRAQDKLPLHRQLYEALRRAILDGKLSAGDRLPSSRELTQDMKMSRNTVVAALSQLAVEGYLVSHIGSGTFVNDSVPRSAARRHSAQENQGAALSQRGQALSTTFCAKQLEIQPFTPGIADFTAFPVALWQRLQNKHWRMTYPEMLDYNDSFAACHWRLSRSSLPAEPNSRWSCAPACWLTTSTPSGSKTRPTGVPSKPLWQRV
jgi:GntR family transcriptional regulator/MocR family aminotransferase